MLGTEFSDISFWWSFPLVIMVFCYFMMRGRRGSPMCGFGSRDSAARDGKRSDSAKEILDKRYARGEIDHREYEEKMKTISTV